MIDPQGQNIANIYARDSRTAGYMPVFGEKKAPSPAASPETFKALAEGAAAGQKTSATHAAAKTSAEDKHEGGFLSFLKTIIDVINPLQHIPVISTIYRHLTGDEISPAARVAGDTLYGGPIGTAVALADIAVQEATGRDIGGNMMAMVTGDKKKPAAAPDTQLAAASYAAMEPAAGENNAPALGGGIIWNTPAPDLGVENVTRLINSDPSLQNVSTKFSPPLPPTPRQNTSERTEADRKGPAALSYKTPASSHKTVSAHPHLLAASPALLTMQETLTEADRKPVPSGLIAVSASEADKAAMPQRMMEALDKYGAMKKSATF